MGREITNPEPTSLITLPASAASPMTEDFARDVERRPMIHGSSYHRQADGDVYTRFESKHLDGTVALVVIHGHDDVVVTACREEEERVRRQWTYDVQPAGTRSLHRRHNLDGLFSAAEQTIFAGVRIDAAHADPGIVDARMHECLVSATNDALHQRGIDALNGVEQTDMRGHVNDAQFRRDQH